MKPATIPLCSIHRNKRASAYGIMVYLFEHTFFRMLFLIIVILSMLFLFHAMLTYSVDGRLVEKNVLVYNLYYNPAGFSYIDPQSGRTYPGLIDLDKFNDRQLDSAASFSNAQHIAVQFTLLDPATNSVLKQATLNKQYFDMKYPLAQKRVKGTGSAVLYEEEVPVRYLFNAATPEKTGQATLKIQTVVGPS